MINVKEATQRTYTATPTRNKEIERILEEAITDAASSGNCYTVVQKVSIAECSLFGIIARAHGFETSYDKEALAITISWPAYFPFKG